MSKETTEEKGTITLTPDGSQVTRIEHTSPSLVLKEIQQSRVECKTCGWSDLGGKLLIHDCSPEGVNDENSPNYGEFNWHLMCRNCKEVLIRYTVESVTHPEELNEAEKIVSAMRELVTPLEQKESIPRPMNRAM